MWFFSRYLLLIGLTGLAVACGSRPGGQAPVTALVAGHVSAGPITPVSRAGHPNSRPLAGARVEALRDSRVVAVTRTDHEGNYKLTLRAGTYVIAVTGSGYPLYPPRTRTVVAAAGHEVTADFTLDTGIR